MSTKEAQNLAQEVLSTDLHIRRVAIIDLEGNVLIDQLGDVPNPVEISDEQILFYYQVGLRRSRREYFNDEYGPVSYVHINREKMQQLIMYLPMITFYLTLDEQVTPDQISQIANKAKKIDKQVITAAIKSHVF